MAKKTTAPRSARMSDKMEGHAPTRDEIADSGETAISVEEMAAREVRDDLTFLGREFLTWLVWHADVEGGSFDGTPQVAPFTVGIGGRLTLRAPGGIVSDMTLKGSSPSTSADLRYALAGGLAVKEVELTVDREDRSWRFGLAAEHLDVKRAKLPAVVTDESDEKTSVLDDRLALLDELDAALRHAFDHFLALRTDAAWRKKTVPAIRRWLEDGTRA